MWVECGIFTDGARRWRSNKPLITDRQVFKVAGNSLFACFEKASMKNLRKLSTRCSATDRIPVQWLLKTIRPKAT